MESSAQPTKKIGHVRRGWELTKSSWRVLKKDRELTVFPLISTVSVLVITVLFVGLAILINIATTGETLTVATEQETQSSITQGWTILVMFLFYLSAAFIVNFFAGAVIYGALQRFRGEDPTVRSCLSAARKRVVSIFGFSLLSATVGTILRLIEERVPFAGRIAVWITGAAWAIATMFAIPFIMAKDEPVKPLEATRGSIDTVKKAWGESFVSQISLGIIELVFYLGFFAIMFGLAIAAGAGLGNDLGAGIAAGIGVLVVLGLVVIGLIFSALSAIAKAAVFHYATTGQSPEAFDRELIRSSMTPKKARKIFG